MIPLLDSKTLKRFLKKAGEELHGDWILIGGTVLPLLGINHRVTTDIDLLPLDKLTLNSVVLDLMALAEKLNLPVETINQAGLYFLEKIPNYWLKMVLLHKGPTATLYRPDINLFLELKMKRLSEADYSDCIDFIKYAKKKKEPINITSLETILSQEIKMSYENPPRRERLEKLLHIIRQSTSGSTTSSY